MQTIGERYNPAMTITDQAEADAYFEKLVAEQMEISDVGREEAERIERMNLAYYAGYFGKETRERAERLFKCAHPVFGGIAENGPPTPEQIKQAGWTTKLTK